MAQAFRRVPWVEVAMSSRPGEYQRGFTPKSASHERLLDSGVQIQAGTAKKSYAFCGKILALAPFLSAIHERDQCHSDINWYVRMDL